MEPTVKSSLPRRGKGESRLSLLQGLGILMLVGIVAKLLVDYVAR